MFYKNLSKFETCERVLTTREYCLFVNSLRTKTYKKQFKLQTEVVVYYFYFILLFFSSYANPVCNSE